MDTQISRLLILTLLIAASMLVVIGFHLIRLARKGNTFAALMGITGLLAGITYEINRWVSYALMGVIVFLVVMEIKRVYRQ